MNYRRIQINSSSVDKESESLLIQIAKWHNLTPKLWNPNYRMSASDMDETVNRIKNTKNQDLFLMIAEDRQGQIQGFIWADKMENSKDSIMILSLYVTEAYRGQGIATKLKLLLEEWCRTKNIKTLHTTTHYNNQKMIELNKKLGYTPGMVSMTKNL